MRSNSKKSVLDPHKTFYCLLVTGSIFQLVMYRMIAGVRVRIIWLMVACQTSTWRQHRDGFPNFI
jgi:hypothetical protein